jgi:CHASE2 domain-containing sensor protein
MTRSKYILPAVVTTIVFLLILIPSINSFLNSSLENGFQNLKGMENPDSNIVIIHINSEDIEKLGGWPLKRSYYALIIEKLSYLNVKTIGLEIFFSQNYSGQGIYNKVLSNSIKEKNNIVLASLADNVSFDDGKYSADSLLIPEFGDENIQLLSGHLNFIEDNGIIIPASISHAGRNELSFSVQLSEQSTQKDAVKINFISDWQMFKNYSLLEFFNIQDYENEKFNDKLIIIGVSDPLISKSVSVVFNQNLPGVGIHAFALDNILNDRNLNFKYLNISSFLFFLTVIAYFIVGRPKLKNSVIILLMSFFLFYVVWSYFYVQLDYFALLLPLLVGIAGQLFFKFTENRELLTQTVQESQTLKQTLTDKEEKLKVLQDELEQQKATPSEA